MKTEILTETKKIKVNDFIQFIGNDKILYKVLQIKKDYILYYEPEYSDTLWERIEYIQKAFEVKEK